MKPFLQWLFTFLGFPLGGLLSIQVVGTIEGPASGAAAGLIAGTTIGGAQSLALRSFGIDVRWIAVTAVAMAAGTAIAAALLDSGTETRDLALQGVIAGLAVGIAQASVLGRGIAGAVAWALTVPSAWALGWVITSSIGVDVERGYALFGSSGAVAATIITGVVLQFVLRADATHPTGRAATLEQAA